MSRAAGPPYNPPIDSPAQSPAGPGPRRGLRLAAKLLAVALGTLLLLALVEGASSLVVVARELARSGAAPVTERKHTVYDPLLGWVNAKGVALPDAYGPGIGLTTGPQGFRGPRDHGRAEPPGKLRVVCTGDSFTLGYGVSDRETWVSVLEELDPRLETVNMGQGGYGVDQAFLWYRRDGLELEHGLHLFAFIAGDFLRAQRDRNFGSPKPVLRAEQGRLVVDNTPVPRLPYLFPYLARNRDILSRLRVLELLGGGAEPAGPGLARRAGGEVVLSLDELRAASLALFAELARLHAERGSTCVVVHLPTQDMWRTAEGPNPSATFLRALAPELEALGLSYVDLGPALRELPEDAAAALYIPEGQLADRAAAGHFSAAGNRWAAERIRAALLELPAVAERLSRL